MCTLRDCVCEMDAEDLILDEDYIDGSDDDEPLYEYMNETNSVSQSSSKLNKIAVTRQNSDSLFFLICVGPASTPASTCVSPLVMGGGSGDMPPSPSHSLYAGMLVHGSTYGGKPQSIRRGPGRPRKEFMPGQRQVARDRIMKRVRGGGAGGMRGGMGAKRKMLNLNQWAQNSGLLTHLTSPSSATSQDSFLKSLVLSGTTQMGSNDDISISLTGGSGSTTPLPTTSPALVPSSPSMDQDMSIVPYTGGSAEKIMQPPEEPPYFPEKWPGKVCALCCLGERSQLGQGEMLRIEMQESESATSSLNSSMEDGRMSVSSQEAKSPRSGGMMTGPQLSNRRQKGLNKCK